MKVWKPNWKYIFGVIGMAVLVVMVLDFNSRMADWRRQRSQRDQIGAQATHLYGTYVYLKTQIAYATSERAVIDYARQSGHMQQPGDQVVVPLAPANSTPVPSPTVAVTPEVIQNWELWLRLFTDSASAAP